MSVAVIGFTDKVVDGETMISLSLVFDSPEEQDTTLTLQDRVRLFNEKGVDFTPAERVAVRVMEMITPDEQEAHPADDVKVLFSAGSSDLAEFQNVVGHIPDRVDFAVSAVLRTLFFGTWPEGSLFGRLLKEEAENGTFQSVNVTEEVLQRELDRLVSWEQELQGGCDKGSRAERTKLNRVIKTVKCLLFLLRQLPGSAVRIVPGNHTTDLEMLESVSGDEEENLDDEESCGD